MPSNKPVEFNKNSADDMFGDSKAPDGSLVKDNFFNWFSGSKITNDDGSPIKYHHGTGNLNAIVSSGFSYSFIGQGNDQLGSGWYFTNKLSHAEGYTNRRIDDSTQKIGGECSPGVVDVFLSIKNPIQTVGSENVRDQLPDITVAQAKKMILMAPCVRDEDGPLSEWGDLSSESFESILRTASKAYEGPSFFSLANDFYRDNPKEFLENFSKVTGYDGFSHKISSEETHVVAWFPSQIKGASLNNGLYDKNCNDLTDSSSGRLNSASSVSIDKLSADSSAIVRRAEAAAEVASNASAISSAKSKKRGVSP